MYMCACVVGRVFVDPVPTELDSLLAGRVPRQRLRGDPCQSEEKSVLSSVQALAAGPDCASGHQEPLLSR